MKAFVHMKTCTQMFIAALSVTTKEWKQNMVYPYNGILFGHKGMKY